MKNLTSLVQASDVHDFVRGQLLKSKPFQQSYDERRYVYQQVENYAYLPRLFAKTSNDYLERAHFCTWWNVIMIREDYDNPIINDLYYLHEMAHAATMPYIPDIGRAAFDEKMQRNELEASVKSEIAVYFEMAELRGNSFDHAIYADRFLEDPRMQALWRTNRKVAVETLRSMRRDVMVSKDPSAMDLTEIWIRKFTDQNDAYSLIWADRYNEIEGRLSTFQGIVCRGEEDSRATGLFYLRDWLEAEAGKDKTDNIPFREEAELFAPHYWANKAKYNLAMAQAEKPKLESRVAAA